MITIETIGKKLIKLQGRNDWYAVLCDVFELSAISLSNQFDLREPLWTDRENRYKDIIKKYNEAEHKLIAEIFSDIYILLSGMATGESPFDDYLGKLYMYSGTQSKGSGQFFTPYCVSKLMGRLSITKEDVERKFKEDPNRIFTLHEPTCGSGGLILAGVEALQECGVNYANDLLVVCGDLDKRCVHMTYIQLALAGVPAVIFHQDALTLQTWDVWHTPAYCLNYLRLRKAFKKVEPALNKTTKKLDDEEKTRIETTPVVEEPQKSAPEEVKEESQSIPQEEIKPVSYEKISLFDFEF